jgi:hypothetical protein
MLKKNKPSASETSTTINGAVPGRKKVTDVSGHPRGVMVPAQAGDLKI